MTADKDAYIDELIERIGNQKDLIAEQKKQAYLHSKSYLELLEMIVEDLAELEPDKWHSHVSWDLIEPILSRYNKKLWSQKK